MSKPLDVLSVVGTRPEVVKMAPVVRRLAADPRFRSRVCATGQHRDLLDSMLADFELKPDVDLHIMRPAQSPTDVLARALEGLDRVLGEHAPDVVLIQGDTTTVLAAALAAFHRKIPVAHLEAGLRSFDLKIPFPEEGNRVAVDRLSDVLLAPTATAKKNLLNENLKNVYVTGNTAVDALLWAAGREREFSEPELRYLPGGKLAVVTLHRRESFGKPLEGVLKAIRRAAESRADLTWVYPVHPNPAVQEAAKRLLDHPRVRLVPPLGYLDFVGLMKRAEFIVTDSGGIQEEAPSLKKPVLVMRDKTERTEAIGHGSVLVGVSGERLLQALARIPKPASKNPFGDGKAADRVAEALLHWSGRSARRPRDFV